MIISEPRHERERKHKVRCVEWLRCHDIFGEMRYKEIMQREARQKMHKDRVYAPYGCEPWERLVWYSEVQGDCRIWNRSLFNKGTPRVNFVGIPTSARRLSLIITDGPVGHNKILSLCNNHLCINPDHLYTVPKKS